MAATRRELKKFIRELEKIRGRHTELVTVYVPAGYDLIKIIQHLQEEQGTAKNIKDAKTRGNVIDSLEKCIRHLRLFKNTPEFGLAVFAGNVAAQEGKVDLKVWSIEPPSPLNTRMYRCDQTFVLDLLRDMTESKDIYGLIVMDRREATIGYLKGTLIQKTQHMTSGVPGKIKAGGQCLHPDALVRNGSLAKIGDIKIGDKIFGYNFKTNEFEYSPCLDFWKTKKNKLCNITFAGSSLLTSGDHLFYTFHNGKICEKLAQELRKNDFLVDAQLKPVRIDRVEIEYEEKELVDISVLNESFIANGVLVHNSAMRYERIREGKAIEFYKRIADACATEFLEKIEKKEVKGILLGGPGPTKEEFKDYLNNEIQKRIAAIQDLAYTDESGLEHLVEKSKDVLAKEIIAEEKALMERFFEGLAKEGNVAYGEERVRKALGYGAVDILLISEEIDDDKTEELEREADLYGTTVKIISTETTEGKQLRDLGGFGAILRYNVDV